ncbi:acetyl-CoA carboxylase carboxyltransferase subunit [Myxococcota bacterium]|nr:acetyl-CoA carboxylase carboxyltransferase subunit [Myxococcota bacterium]
MSPKKSHRDKWEPLLSQLEERRAEAKAMGGSERVERLMHSRGKLDARQRIECLFDPGTFVEIGALGGNVEGIPADAFVCGTGRIAGRSAVAGVEDFSVMGGSIGGPGSAKRYRVAEIAMRERIPLVMMLEGAGHRLTAVHDGRAPNDLLAMADLSGHVPMVCMVMGASAGHGALAAPLSDFVIMTSSASMFTGGPPLVKAALGEDVTKEELGGAKICTEIAGSAHNVAGDDASAIEMARRYLSYLPQNREGTPPRCDGTDTKPRLVDELLDIIPPNDRQPYSMRKVIDLVFDEASVFEIQPRYGRSLVTALAFLGGRSVAVVANDPSIGAGAVDSAAAIKATDFLDVVGNFGLPVIFLADNPGVMAGTRAEREGILKWGGKMFHAERRLTNKKIHVNMRKAFGFGMVTMAGTPFDHQSLTFSLPGVNAAAMPAGSGGRSAKLDPETQNRVEEEQRSGPYRMADRLGVDDVLDPRELRNALLNGIELGDC